MSNLDVLASPPVADRAMFDFLRAARRDKRLSPGAFRVLAELVDRVDRRGGRLPDPSGQDLADASAVSRRQVFRLVAELEALGLVRVVSRKAQRLSAVYQILWDAYAVPASEAKPERKRRVLPRRADGVFAAVPKRPGAAEPVQAAEVLQRHRGRASGPVADLVISSEERKRRAALADAVLAGWVRPPPLLAAE